MPVFADRVQETSTVTGTGALSLAGPVQGYQSFASAFPAATTANVPYTITDGAGNWETGHGTFTLSGATLTRVPAASSNGGSLVSFPAGTKQVFNTLLAADAIGVNTLVQTTGTIAIAAGPQNNYEVQLTQNATFAAPTNLTGGMVINLAVQQPASGGPYTIAFASVWDFGGAGAPTASTVASKVDFVSGYYHAPTSKILASFRKGT